MKELIPDWNGRRYWGEVIMFYCPGLYGQPVYYTNGERIPYEINIPEMDYLTMEDLTKE